MNIILNRTFVRLSTGKEGIFMAANLRNMMSEDRSEQKSPSVGLNAHKEGCMENIETREQTMQKIEYHLLSLTDAELRMVSGFIRGIKKNQG